MTSNILQSIIMGVFKVVNAATPINIQVFWNLTQSLLVNYYYYRRLGVALFLNIHG
jgi:ferric iron reductase protein FhuF